MIEILHRDGIAVLGKVPWIDRFTRFLEKMPREPGHVASRPRPGVFHHNMRQVMQAPHFLDYARSFTPLASEYFGEPAHLWSLNAFITDENTPLTPSIMEWHRDREAEKILVLFVYGTDVDPEGAHCYITGSHRDWNLNPVTGARAHIWGPRGTAFLADTTGLHCGLRPNKERLIAWARWANVVPKAKTDENLPDIP